MSPEDPPVAANSLVQPILFKTAVVDPPGLLSNVTPEVSMLVSVPAGAFELIPPPFKYVNVKVVLTGAAP